MKLIAAGIAFFGAWTEWTGFITNFGIALVLIFWPKKSGTPESRSLALGVIIGTIAAGITILVHLLLSLPVASVIEALARRAKARSSIGAEFEYLEQLALSFGPFIVVALFMPLWRFWNSGDKPGICHVSGRTPRDLKALIVVSAIPCFENLLLLQHATEFSFDRLKVAVPISLTIAYSMARIRGSLGQWLMAASIVVASVVSIKTYLREKSELSFWSQVHSSNLTIKDRVSDVIDLSNARILTNGPVRGYLNLLFNRSISEKADFESLREDRKSPWVFIEADSSLTDLPEISSITIFDSKSITTIHASSSK
jgi:hypothetical protein